MIDNAPAVDGDSIGKGLPGVDEQEAPRNSDRRAPRHRAADRGRRVLSVDQSIHRKHRRRIHRRTIRGHRARVSGKVVSLDVNDNQFVKKGQPLIHIDRRQYEIDREQAEGALETARNQSSGLRLGAEIARKNFPPN